MKYPTKLPRGGVNPPAETLVPPGSAIASAAVPSRALIPLLQHSGKAAICLVNRGTVSGRGCSSGRRMARDRQTSTPRFPDRDRGARSPPSRRRAVHGSGHRARRRVRNIGAATAATRMGEALAARPPRPRPFCRRRRAGWCLTADPPEARRRAGQLVVDSRGQRRRIGTVTLRRRGAPSGEGCSDRRGSAHLPGPPHRRAPSSPWARIRRLSWPSSKT